MSEVEVTVESKSATNQINQGNKDRGRKVNSNCKRGKKLKIRRSLSTEKSLLPSKPQDPSDPLNLRSLLDPEINDRLKADTPHVSPMHPRVAKANTILNDNKILVPPQTNDPLMLNREDIEYDKRVRTLKKRKRKLSKEASDKSMQVNKKSRHDNVMDANKKTRNAKQKLFIYGNYDRYYGYRNKTTHDCRLDSWNKEWFDGKDCLDIGCNVGFLTIEIAKKFNPHKIVGIDIDGSLINKARSNIVRANTTSNSSFPISFNICHGPIIDADNDNDQIFPKNIIFKQENYIVDSMEDVNKQKPLYDVILCLSLTKWVHLNWGDQGVKMLFKRIFVNLRHGGVLILEPQSFDSYKKKKRLTSTIRKNFDEIKFMPEQFNDYLLSEEIGFASCQTLPTPNDAVKGFGRAMLLFMKS